MLTGDASVDYNENGMSAVGTYTANGPVAASWSLEGDDMGAFSIGGSSGELMFASPPDFEAPADMGMDNMYQVTVKAEAGGEMDTMDVTVTVTNVAELGMLTGDASVDYNENGMSAVGTYTADGPVAAIWSLEGDDMGAFSIGGSSGELMFASPPDFEAPADMGMDNMYQVTVKAEAGGEMDTMDVTVTVTNVAELGMLTGDASVDYNENGMSAVGTYTADGPVAAIWSLEGDDMGAFSIGGSSGELMFASPPDFEAPADMGMDNMYQVTVKAEAGGGMDMMDVTVTVTNVEEQGRVTFWRDGADATTAVIVVGDELGGAVDDSDGNPNDARTGRFPIAMNTRIDAANVTSWQWAKTKTPDMMESWMPITGATDAAYMVTADDTGYYLRATAMYSDGEGSDKSAMGTTKMVTTIPMFESETDTREIAEDTEPGMDIGDPVMGTDADGDTLIYTLGGKDAASFAIDSETGQLMTLAALDYETKDSYEVMVTATDPDSASDMITVTITVTDVDEAPMITGDPAPNYAENGTGPVTTYSATDPESATITWSLEGDDAADFEISTGGVLTFRTSPDYEAAADDDTDNAYMVTVKANDGTYTDTHDVMVMVTNMDEAGTVTLSTMQPQVGVELTASVEDPDGMVTGETWQWASSDAMDGTFTPIEGAMAMSDSYTPVADDVGKHLQARASYTDAEGSGKSAEGVTANAVTAGDPLLARYDTDQNGEIERAEVFAGINDYLDGGADAPTRADVFKLIELYLGD